jgi:DNA replication protein DnaC
VDTLIREYAKRLKLSWIGQNYHKIQADTNEEYLLKIFETEIKKRDERKINLLIKQASLPRASDKPFDWKDIQMGHGLTPEVILQGDFIENQENLIFYGGVGTGKTYLSTLIALNVIQKKEKTVKFFTVAGLINRLLDAHETGSLSHLFKQLEKIDLIILDELGYIPLHKQGAELLFQVISMCYEHKSIIVTTNLQFGQWNHVFGDPILTEAVIDRLIHHSHLVVFNGDSQRYRESILHSK